MGALKDYILNFVVDGGSVEPRGVSTVVTDGDFLFVREIKSAGVSAPFGVDAVCEVTFDDESKLTMRVGDVVRQRPYKRFVVKIKDTLGDVNTGIVLGRDVVVLLSAGFGEIVPRAGAVVPLTSKSISVVVGAGASTIVNSGLLNVDEVRINVPSSSADGLFYRSRYDVDSADATRKAFLERGIVEYIRCGEEFYLKNESGSAITAYVTFFYKKF